MDKEQKNLDQQEAPLKNTDNAFVKVNSDGKPEMPVDEQQQQEEASLEQERKEAMSERD